MRVNTRKQTERPCPEITFSNRSGKVRPRGESGGPGCGVQREKTCRKFVAPLLRGACVTCVGDLGMSLKPGVQRSSQRFSADQRAGVWDLSVNGPAAFDAEAFEVKFFFPPDGGQLFASRSRDGDSAGFRWRLRASASAGGPPELTRLALPKAAGFTSLALASNSVVMTTASGSRSFDPEFAETRVEGWARTGQGIHGDSPDGRWLAIYRPFSASLHTCRMPGMEPVATLNHPANIGWFEFSPAGGEVAVASRWGTEFYATATWTRTRTPAASSARRTPARCG